MPSHGAPRFLAGEMSASVDVPDIAEEIDIVLRCYVILGSTALKGRTTLVMPLLFRPCFDWSAIVVSLEMLCNG